MLLLTSDIYWSQVLTRTLNSHRSKLWLSASHRDSSVSPRFAAQQTTQSRTALNQLEYLAQTINNSPRKGSPEQQDTDYLRRCQHLPTLHKHSCIGNELLDEIKPRLAHVDSREKTNVCNLPASTLTSRSSARLWIQAQLKRTNHPRPPSGGGSLLLRVSKSSGPIPPLQQLHQAPR